MHSNFFNPRVIKSYFRINEDEPPYKRLKLIFELYEPNCCNSICRYIYHSFSLLTEFSNESEDPFKFQK